VDLIEAYSKRLDLADALVSAVRQLQQAQAQTGEPAPSMRSTPLSHRQWRVGDRLRDADTEQLIAAFTAGTSKRMLAEPSVASARAASNGSYASMGHPSRPVGYIRAWFSPTGEPRGPGSWDTGSAPWRVVDQTRVSVRGISVQRPVGEAGTGEVDDCFQYQTATARAAGNDPPFCIVKISEEAEEGMQLAAEVVEAGRGDGEQADALFIEVRCTAGRSPAVRAVRDGTGDWLPCRWRDDRPY
jgi:hypothetical protein